ncbi:MAG TPA: PAS domain S-box protein [Anaerolineales bacterium]|nr:PAS domain S-box protein [Anaerolineales bacterium]
MSPSEDFYALLSSLLQQTAKNPDAPPAIPLKRWSAGSPEQFLLEDLQAALAALQTGNQNPPSQAKEREQRYQSIFETASDGLIINDVETGRVVEANPAACTMYGYARDEFIGLHPTSFIHPDSSHQFTKYVQAVQSQGVYVALQVHMRRDGSQFYVELSGTVYTDQGRLYLLSVVRDVSQRVHSERLLQQRVEARTREQSTLLEISQTLASALELQPGLILDQLRVIIDYSHAGLFKLEGSTLAALAVRGPQPLERAMPFRIRLQSPEALTMLFNERRSTRIADVQSSDPPARFLRSLLDDQASILLEGVQSWMWVPLAIKGRVIGAVGVAHAERNFFTAHHAVLALTVANQAAITMVNAELYEHAHTLAALQERQRLARNLHDAVNQSLFSAGLIAEVLPRLWERDPDEGRQSLEDLRRLTRGAQADMRLLLAELRPSTLTDAELGDLLRLLGNALAGRTNIPISVTVTGQEALQEERSLPADVQVALYRLCQEGLNNVAKHAGASRVDIQLQYETGAVELRIRDDGRGFDPEQMPPGHYGLSMMRERATAVGATLSITSQPGHGTEIVIRWVETQEQKAG